MLTYLAIGLAVQLLITFERAVIRKVVPTDFSNFSRVDWFTFVGVLVIGGISNILAWPFAIVEGLDLSLFFLPPSLAKISAPIMETIL